MDDTPKNKCSGIQSCFKQNLSTCMYSFLPSKQQLNDKQLQNRMKLCALAVCLMWAASLKVAVYISSFVVQVPSIHLLYESCRGAWGVTNDEKTTYSHCVNIQLNQCDADLGMSIEEQITNYNVSRDSNENMLSQVKEISIQSLANYTTLRDSLDTWANVGKQPIPINNSTCSPQERDAILNIVGDVNALTSEVMILGEGYSATSQNSVQRIGTYAKLRMTYDQEYLDNHTQEIQESIQEYMKSLDIPQINVDELVSGLFLDIDNLVPCVSPSDEHGVCQFVKGAPEHLAEVWQDYYELVDLFYVTTVNYHLLAIEYIDNVKAAFQVTAAFYNGM